VGAQLVPAQRTVQVDLANVSGQDFDAGGVVPTEAPALSFITPTSSFSGNRLLNITVLGSNFNPASVVQYNKAASITADGTVTVKGESLWRTTAVGRISRIAILDLSTRVQRTSFSASSSTITQTDTTGPSFGRMVQEVTFSLPDDRSLPQGSCILRYDSCCRIDGLNNAPEDDFSLKTVVHFDGTANSEPQLFSSVITGVSKGFAYSQNINAADPDGGSLSYQFLVGRSAPTEGPSIQISGITVSAVGQIEIPSTNTNSLEADNVAGEPAGDYIFKLRITDSFGAYTDRDVLLDIVTGTNTNPPVLGATGNRAVAPGGSLNLNLMATDADTGDVVTLSTRTLPANSTFTQTSGNPATGIFAFSPTLSEIGTHQINFEARDNGSPNLVDSELITITVQGTNRAPVLSPPIGSRSISAGGTLSVTIAATDPDKDTLSFTASFLPSGATFDTSTKTFSWVAPSSGVFTGIVFRVTDSGSPALSTEAVISISVGAANQAPSLEADRKQRSPPRPSARIYSECDRRGFNRQRDVIDRHRRVTSGSGVRPVNGGFQLDIVDVRRIATVYGQFCCSRQREPSVVGHRDGQDRSRGIPITLDRDRPEQRRHGRRWVQRPSRNRRRFRPSRPKQYSLSRGFSPAAQRV
jgi:hypothetical protein